MAIDDFPVSGNVKHKEVSLTVPSGSVSVTSAVFIMNGVVTRIGIKHTANKNDVAVRLYLLDSNGFYIWDSRALATPSPEGAYTPIMQLPMRGPHTLKAVCASDPGTTGAVMLVTFDGIV